MGAGKTKVLIAILDQHFEDPRKKLPIFPTKALALNLYEELLRWPNRYRKFFSLMQPELAAQAVPLQDGLSLQQMSAALEEKADAEWKVPPANVNEIRNKLQVELELTGVTKDTGERVCAINRGRLTTTFRRWFQAQFPDRMHLLPRGPLRAMNLSTAGGSFSAKKDSGEARHPVAQFGYDVGTKNVFDNAIVVMDEVHNVLLRSNAKQFKLFLPQVRAATNLTMIGSLLKACLLEPALLQNSNDGLYMGWGEAEKHEKQQPSKTISSCLDSQVVNMQCYQHLCNF